MPQNPAVAQATLQQWITLKMDIQAIRDELMKHGHDNETIDHHIKEFKKLKYGQRQMTGFILMILGAVLGFISCLLTILNPVPELYYWILYGLTSIAIAVICVGMYFVFE